MATPKELHQRVDKTQDPKPLSWGLKRLTSGGRLTNVEGYDYTYDDNACGEGVTIYILGGTIQATHVDFNYPMPVICDKSDKDKSNKYPNPRIGLPDIDGIDYGTFAAGIAAGSGSGVAKKATIVQVPTNDITKATSKILLDYKIRKDLNDEAYPAVVNISRGYVNELEVNRSLVELIEAGIHVVVAAGDEDKPLPEPGRNLESVIWVGASTLEDKKWKSSNYGPGVDLFAPGKDINSATRSSKNIYSDETHSGTAFAAPHVTGIIACLLSHTDYWDLSPKKMKAKILAMAEDVALMDEYSMLESVRHVLGAELAELIKFHYDKEDEDELRQLFKKKALEMVQKTYIDEELLPPSPETSVIMEGIRDIQRVVNEVEENVGKIKVNKEDISQYAVDADMLEFVGPVLGIELVKLATLHHDKTEDELHQLFKEKALEMVQETYINANLLPPSAETPVIMNGIRDIQGVIAKVKKNVEDKIQKTLKDENIQPPVAKSFMTKSKLASCQLKRWPLGDLSSDVSERV